MLINVEILLSFFPLDPLSLFHLEYLIKCINLQEECKVEFKWRVKHIYLTNALDSLTIR